MRARRWSRHEVHELTVEFGAVEIILDDYALFSCSRLVSWFPDERVAVGRSVIDGDVEVEARGNFNNRGVEPGYRR